MLPDTPKLAQLIADYHSISLQLQAEQSKAADFTHLFNSTKQTDLQVNYQDRAIVCIHAALLLQARLSELEILISSYKLPA